jgi:hypothetical protein
MSKPLRSKIRLSKSKYLQGLQCTKLLYKSVHEPETFPEASEALQAVFDTGHEVGIRAQAEFPGGVLIKAGHREPDAAIAETQAAIENGALAIFEAAFRFEDVLIRVDVFSRKSAKAAWDLYEVKSTTDIKDVHLPDIAVQTWVLQNCGLRLGKQYLMHLNRECVYPDLSNLFCRVEVTDTIEEPLKDVPSRIAEFRRVLQAAKPPQVAIGPHCDDPYGCALKDECWKKIPVPSVFDVPRLGEKKKWFFFESGAVSLSKIPKSDLNETQLRMVKVSLGAKTFVDSEGITAELGEWEYPLSFFDFETIAPAIPRFRGATPYSQIPVQWSCHVVQKPGGKSSHFEFLHEEESDPRPALINALLDSLPERGSIVAYNAGFERGVLAKLADFDKRNAKKIRAIADRIVDLLPVVRDHVYHKEFLGSFSIKAVAPALLGKSLSYEGMEVADGTGAQLAFEQLVYGNLSKTEKDALKRAMLEYCEQDTRAMVKLFEWLQERVGELALP